MRRTARFAVLALLVLLAVGFVLLVSGLPPDLVRLILKHTDTGNYAISVNSVQMDVMEGVRCKNLRLYRKKNIGPPALEGKKVDLRLDIPGWSRGRSLVREIHLEDAILRPAQFFAAAGTPSQTAFDTDLRIVAKRCNVFGLLMESLRCRVVSDGHILHVEDVDASLSSGELKGQLSGAFQYDAATRILEGTINLTMEPHLLLPLFDAVDIPALRWWTERFGLSGVPPRMQIQFRRYCAANPWFRMTGDFSFADFEFRGVPVEMAHATTLVEISATRNVLQFKPLKAMRQDGQVTLDLDVDMDAQVAEFKVNSEVHPEALAVASGLITNGQLHSWLKFDSPAAVVASGKIGYGKIEDTVIDGSAQGADLTLLKMPFRGCRADVSVRGGTVVCSNMVGRFCGSQVRGSAAFQIPLLAAEGFSYGADLALDGASFGEVAALFSKEKQDYGGTVSGAMTFRGSSLISDLSDIEGEGAVSIKNGKLFLIPLFGGLSELLSRFVPGVNLLLRQNDFSAAFQIKDGVIRSEKVLMEGDVLSLDGHGAYYWDQRLDFLVRASLMKEHTFIGKLMRPLTYPFSKLLEFRLHGTAREPRWYPVNFSSDLVDFLTPGGTNEEAAVTSDASTAIEGDRP